MDNFITIKNVIYEEISKLEYNLKQLDINYIIYINKLVDNLKEYLIAQRNIYPSIKNKSIIKSLDTLLVNYYNKNKDIFKSIKQIHKNSNKTNNKQINLDNNIKLNTFTNENNIFNYTPKFKFIMNSYIKSKSLKKLKTKISNYKSKEYLLENNFSLNNLFNNKLGIFIKKKLQNKNNSSSPCLFNKNKNNIKTNNGSSFSLKEINDIKENNKILEKKISDLIIEENVMKNNEVNNLLRNYNKLYEIYKLINEDNVINDINKEEYIMDKKNIKENYLNKNNINEFIDNIYEKILEIIEIKKNIFKENKMNEDLNSIKSNNIKINDNNNNYYIEIIMNKLKNINNYLINNKVYEKPINNDINIIKENNNLLSLSEELETPKSNSNILENSKNNEENYDNKHKKIIELLDINEKLIKERYEDFNNLNKENVSDKNISEKLDTNLIDNNLNNNIINFSNSVSFRNNK